MRMADGLKVHLRCGQVGRRRVVYLMTAEPQLFHKIVDPNEFFAELDAQAEAYQHDKIEREVRQEKPETHNSLPFLGAN